MNRKQFYQTKEWKKIRKLVIIKQGGICSRCSNPIYYIHHKTYLTDNNYLDPSISMNEDNLEGLCVYHHNEEHNPSKVLREGLAFDIDGNIKPML